MKTPDVIETIRRIESLYDKETSDFVFGSDRETTATLVNRELLPRFISATHEMARAGATISQDPQAMQILKAFDLEPLFDKDFITNMALSASSDPTGEKLCTMLEMIREPWRAMIGCVSALESLTSNQTTKVDLKDPQLFSVDVAIQNCEDMPIMDIQRIMELINQLYTSAAIIYNKGKHEDLKILRPRDATTIRFIFRGESVIVKPLRDFITKAWYELRHQSMENLLANSRQLMSLSVNNKHINSGQHHNGELSTEDTDWARKKLMGATFGLFAYGVKPVEHKNGEPQTKRVTIQSK
jgi:hypothetical protein